MLRTLNLYISHENPEVYETELNAFGAVFFHFQKEPLLKSFAVNPWGSIPPESSLVDYLGCTEDLIWRVNCQSSVLWKSWWNTRSHCSAWRLSASRGSAVMNESSVGWWLLIIASTIQTTWLRDVVFGVILWIRSIRENTWVMEKNVDPNLTFNDVFFFF